MSEFRMDGMQHSLDMLAKRIRKLEKLSGGGIVTGFADPTAQVVLVPVAGAATTAMRSDAAPPIDQTIAPNWTSTHSFADGITFDGVSDANEIIIPDNTVIAFELEDVGGVEYLRIVSTDTQPIIDFNAGGVDVDYHVRAFLVPDAFQVRGIDGRITLGALGLGFVQSTAGGVLSSAVIAAIQLPAHTHAGAGQGGPLVIGTTVVGGTLGSVPFVGATGVWTEDNANLFWDNTNNRLGIGNAAPAAALEVNATTLTTPGLIVQTTDDDPTENLIEAQSSAGNIVWAVEVDGGLRGTDAVGKAIILRDGNSLQIFRGVRGGGWSDAATATFFQSATIADPNVFFSGASSGLMGRVGFVGRNFQFAPAGVSQFPIPTGLVEIHNDFGSGGARVPLKIYGNRAQAANLFDMYGDSTIPGALGPLLTYFTDEGGLVVSENGAATEVRAIFRGHATQSVALLQLQKDDGSVFLDSGHGRAGSTFDINQQEEDIDFRVRWDAGDTFFVQGSDGKALFNTVTEDANILATTNVQVIDARLAVSQSGGASNAFDIYTYGAAAVPKATFKHARGTRAAPTATQSGDLLGAFDFTGYGAAFYDSGGAQISGVAAENWGVANRGAHLVFATTPAGSASGFERLRVTDGGMVGINETTNANMDIGLTIDQAANDTEALNVRSSDVGAVLSTVETGTWLTALKASGAAGGARLAGYRDATGGNRQALDLQAYLAEAPNASKDTTGRGIIEISGYQTDGTNKADTVASGNVLVVRTQRGSADASLLVLDENADMNLPSGRIATGNGDYWDIEDYHAGAPTADGYVEVTINGTTIQLLANSP